MRDELRHPLVAQVERLAMDLTVERHGDPHAAVVVLLYPDRHPEVVMVRPERSPYALTSLKWPKDAPEEAESASDSHRFPLEDLEEAQGALSDAGFVFHSSGYRRDRSAPFAQLLSEHLQKNWERRRMAPIERAMAKAEEERKRPEVCRHCGRRFTVRGYPFHLAKSWCAKAEAQLAASENVNNSKR